MLSVGADCCKVHGQCHVRCLLSLQSGVSRDGPGRDEEQQGRLWGGKEGVGDG